MPGIARQFAELMQRPIDRFRANAMISHRGHADLEPRRAAHEFIGQFLRRWPPSRPPLQSAVLDDPQALAATAAPFRIWVYWGQGFDKAPPIVATCRQRLHECNPDAEIIELYDATIGAYAHLPDAVVAKLGDNKTNFSPIRAWIPTSCRVGS